MYQRECRLDRAYFGVDMRPLVERLLGEQLADGGWNCEVENGATVSSFGTTINVLEGLLEHERAIGGSSVVAAARRAGRGVHARAPAVPSEVDRRGDRPDLARVLVPDVVALRRPAGARLLPERSATPDERCSEAIEHVRNQAQSDGRGPWTTATRAFRCSRWTEVPANRAGGSPSARCACSAGPTRHQLTRYRARCRLSELSISHYR